MIGTEHVGAILVPQICQLLTSGQEPYQFNHPLLTLVASHGVDALADKCRREFGEIKIASRQAAVTPKSAPGLFSEDALVFCCDQSRSTARVVSDHCGTLQNITAIRCGCGGDNGAIYVFMRRNGENITLPFVNDFHADLAAPSDSGSERQFMITNIAVASLMLNALHAWLFGRLGEYDEAYVNVTEQTVRQVRLPTKVK
ncbi:hypothetical protein [Anatilimnocola floriformis]|uniref:hypothetical protein n=1 Tax=Anatilimnocola floriformis TaxID=2948575 RepID=UPI0020C4D074|nr:hypothetical protein [Anatilimnocola floriformis]